MARPAISAARNPFRDVRRGDLMMPLVLVGILGLMILPFPPAALDALLGTNITLSVLVLLTAIQIRKPLDFSVFPALLLVSTLFRLGLNVATTRRILLEGGMGTNAAGEIIETFGHFVVKGEIVVGVVVFLIITIINFVVITKGSGRIAEVSARFTLDALPGKQMSIDSDLAAGLITQVEARRRRAILASETDFYGAMDGASKFVRGDAIAGLIITALNIIGGLLIGVVKLGMPIGDAVETYTVLTIGDGLVSQIPTLLISTSAGIVVTRVAEASDLGRQIVRQVLRSSRVLMPTALVLFLLMMVPGMPKLVFVVLIGGIILAARLAPKAEDDDEDKPEEKDVEPRALTEEDDIAATLPVQPLAIEVGVTVVPLIDSRSDGDVVRRVGALRRNFATELGFILPTVHLKDNLSLGGGEYRFLVHGAEVATGSVMADRLMAMNLGQVTEEIEGVATEEPAFGMPALWIRQSQRTQAELAGYMIVTPAEVIITHFSEVIRREADKLLGRDGLQQLLEVVARQSPKVVEELIPTVLSHAEVLGVLRGLLREAVSIRDLTRILEALGEAARFGKQLPFLIDQVRLRLGPTIAQSLLGPDRRLHVALFDAASEDALRRVVVRGEQDADLQPELAVATALVQELQRAEERARSADNPTVVLAPADLRYPLWRFASRFFPRLSVITQGEVPTNLPVVTETNMNILSAPRGRPGGGRPTAARQGRS